MKKYKDEFCPLKARNQIGKETETERPAVFVEKNQFLPPTQKWGGERWVGWKNGQNLQKGVEYHVDISFCCWNLVHLYRLKNAIKQFSWTYFYLNNIWCCDGTQSWSEVSNESFLSINFYNNLKNI